MAQPRSYEEELFERLKQEAKGAGPGFAVSLGLHVLLLIVCAFLVIRHERRREAFTTISGFNGNLLEPRGPRRMPIVPVEIEAVKAEPTERGAAPAAPREPEQPPTGPPNGVRKPLEVNVSGALAARGTGGEGGGQGRGGAGLAGAGGSEISESAVSLGLAWLARQQHADGHWELHQGYPDAGQVRTNTGATALALLAFLGAGETHRDGKYKAKVGKALRWLLAVQKKTGPMTGELYDFDREGDAATFYAHAQATIALCEAFAMTRDAELQGPIQSALAFIYDAQHPQTGGWKYRRHSEGDLSVFGWQIMALQSARMASLDVSGEVLEKATRFLDLVQEQDGALYRYEPNPGKPVTPAMTAEGLLCRQYLGWPRDHPAMRAGLAYLLAPENLPRWDSSRRNIYHWYYAAQVLHNVGGSDWERWNALARDELIAHQVKGAGKVGGSWNPFQPPGASDENSDKGGRLYVTCLSLLTLEVYYRHLPLYRDASQN